MIKGLQSIRFRLTAYFLFVFTFLLILINLIILYYFKSHSIEKGKMSLRDKSFVVGAWIDFADADIDKQIKDYVHSQDSSDYSFV